MIYVSATDNQEAIYTTLRNFIGSSSGNLLEISSGFGRHIALFGEMFPKIVFQPTEFDLSLLDSIDYYTRYYNLTNVLPAKYLDVTTESNEWLDGELKKKLFNYVLNINMMHVTEWKCTEGLFNGSSRALTRNGILFTYGPFADHGVITPLSNIDFNNGLKSLDPSWGFRDITKQLRPVAKKYGLKLTDQVTMPLNTYFLVWRKQF